MIDQERVERLKTYVNGLMNGEDGKSLYDTYKEDIENVIPQEAFEIFYSLIQSGTTPSEILVFLDKVINVFYKSLMEYSKPIPQTNLFLKTLEYENDALVLKVETIKEAIRQTNLKEKKKLLWTLLVELETFNAHYLKKENILFPYMEKSRESFEGVSIMWALHDLIRNNIKDSIAVTENPMTTEKQVDASVAILIFSILGMVKKEKLILFPSAVETIDQEDWIKMHFQSFDYDFPFIEKPEKGDYTFHSETGELSLDQVLTIFNTLPVDMTFVDENNKVRFFSRPKDRIFPRSAAIIGRDVKNCHPPESVHVVEEIIEGFRSGERESAQFWIDIKGKKLLIQYFALRDSNGRYQGTLEVSQDITEIQKIEGQKRLLEWDSNK